jgi:hypothetical protein
MFTLLKKEAPVSVWPDKWVVYGFEFLFEKDNSVKCGFRLGTGSLFTPDKEYIS